jgi:hypothetical protein
MPTAVATSVSAHAVAPRSESPLARGEHPRIFVTRAELPGLRDRLASHYAGELQEFLDLLAGPTLSSAQRRVEAPWGAFNYALVAMLVLKRCGTRVPRRRGDRHAKVVRALLTYTERLLPTNRTERTVASLSTDLADPLHIPVIAAYDWCASQWSQTERSG